MRKFMIKLGIFLLPLILLFVILEGGLNQTDSSYSIKKRLLESQVREIQILNIGSSHAMHGIDPDNFIKKGFNMANVSQSLYYDAGILQQYIGKMDSLETVILPISYFSLGYDLSQSPEYWRMYFYKNSYQLPYEQEHQKFDIKKYSNFALYGQKESLKYFVRGFTHKPSLQYKNSGVLLENGTDFTNSENLSDKTGAERAKSHRLPILEKNVTLLYQMIKTLKDRHIQVVLITLPVYETYYQHMDAKLYQEMQHTIIKIQQDLKVSYLNYLKDPKFESSDFRDNDHLNPKGAKKFTLMLQEELRGLP